MKRRLSKEQTQHLIDLGIAKEKATGKIEIQNGNITDFEYRFTTDDLLETLSKSIQSEDFEDKQYRLRIENTSKGWSACYADTDGIPELYEWDSYYERTELIDALYEVIVWCKNNNYL